ncbi:MAG: zinc-binding dehydrogenase [Sinobacteraceae bacterium]|nr:zinc-binding dehydrogenase [Nevskiaceae bacterium]
MTDIPPRMRALVLHSYEKGAERLQVEDHPVTPPSRGEVLVRVAAAPINPSDLVFLNGLYGFRKPLPVVPGFEGSGTVVATGGGFLARRLLGKRVACAASEQRDGTWAEYAIAPAQGCFPLPAQVNDEQGAMALVNPLCAWGLMEQARRARARAVVSTAAASQVGRMLVRLGQRFGIAVVCVVRRDGQIELMKSLGATHVLNSTDPHFDAQLLELCARLNARLAFDAVGGEMTERLLAALPRGSRITLYGGLSQQPTRLQVQIPIFEGKIVDGFWVPTWIARKNPLQLLLLQRSVLTLLGRELRSEVRQRVAFDEARAALAAYSGEMTSGKMLLVPALERGVSAAAGAATH